MKTFFRSLKITSISLGLLISVAIHLIGCSSDNKISGNEISGNELIELQKQNIELSKLADTLQKQLDFYNNSPAIKLGVARDYFKIGNYFLATKLSGEICTQFPNSKECKESEKIIRQVEIQKDIRIKEEERLKRLGLKVLKPKSKITKGPLIINFSSVSIGKTWTFDRYGTEYRYRQAERGRKFILASVSITSKDKNPLLPEISVYTPNGDKLMYVGTMSYEFKRWKNYGSYLGNYSDYGNDFAHTKTISFNCGVQMDEEKINTKPLFIVVAKNLSFFRNESRYDNPPISYKETTQTQKKVQLQISDFNNGEYELVKILNNNLL